MLHFRVKGYKSFIQLSRGNFQALEKLRGSRTEKGSKLMLLNVIVRERDEINANQHSKLILST
jgi:hypothetical protein